MNEADDILEELGLDSISENEIFNEYRRKWRKNNPGKVKAQQQKHYYANREKEVERVKSYNKKNKAKKQQYDKKYRNENLEKILEQTKLWKRRNKEKVKLYDLRKYIKRKYKISIEEYLSLVQKQGNKCAICFSTEDLCLDHQHEPFKIREFLCRQCNAGIGQFKESEDILYAAINYIVKHRGR